MKIIVDSGSTKMEWVLMDGNAVIDRFCSDGFNPNYSDTNCLKSILYSLSLPHDIEGVYYYGTGCGNEQNCQIIKEVFQNRFPDAGIHVTHDLMAACHALFGHEKGIACILGTGSNSCVYDGKTIVDKAVSLGYLIGDEGSGVHIGREVVRGYFYGLMSEDLKRSFDAEYHLELKDFIQRVYHESQPSRYLASFARFAGENQIHPFVRDLVKGCFKSFVEAFILRFDDVKSMKISFIGSVAFHFKVLLKETLTEYGLTMGEVMQAPAEGLIRYYQNLPA